MNSPDLTALHDFYQPPAPSWMPQTVGWYMLFALLVIVAVLFAVRALRQWFRNRYRREAIREIQDASSAQLSEILKRTALAAWHRPRVAALTGEQWTDFLANSSGLEEFRSAPGNRIEALALSNSSMTIADQQKLKQLAAEWVRLHHV